MLNNIFKKRRTTVGIGVGLVLIVVTVMYFHAVRFGELSGTNPVKVEFEIFRGTGLFRISNMLEREGLVSSALDFYVYARFIARKAPYIKAGDYFLDGTMTPAKILEILQTGREKEYRVTIPDGHSKEEIAQLVAAAGIGNRAALLKAMEQPALIEAFGVPHVGAGGQKEGVPGGIEGYLFPDTYLFPKSISSEEVLNKMRARLSEIIDSRIQQRMGERSLTLHQVLTLASLIEKETGKSSERPMIASVFFNRMRKRMKLQTDPTAVYRVEDFSGRITRKHYKLEHAYNTYVINGLPPGPIASPSKAAIEAVLWPAKTKYLYFVSKNDGSHEFCETFICHQRAIVRWQRDSFRRKKEESIVKDIVHQLTTPLPIPEQPPEQIESVLLPENIAPVAK